MSRTPPKRTPNTAGKLPEVKPPSQNVYPGWGMPPTLSEYEILTLGTVAIIVGVAIVGILVFVLFAACG